MVIHKMQHVTPLVNVESIRELGLLASDPTENWSGDADADPEIGVYVTVNPLTVSTMRQCWRWSHEVMETATFDVNVAGLPLEVDKVEPYDHRRKCIPQDIPPERLIGCAAHDEYGIEIPLPA